VVTERVTRFLRTPGQPLAASPALIIPHFFSRTAPEALTTGGKLVLECFLQEMKGYLSPDVKDHPLNDAQKVAAVSIQRKRIERC